MSTTGARRFAWLILATSVSAHAEPTVDVRPCLRSGEVLTFVVKALGMEGGHLRIETTREGDADASRIRIRAGMATEGFSRTIYKYSNDSISIIDAESGKLLQTQSSGVDGSKSFDRVTVLDHGANGLTHTDRIRPQKSYQAALPIGLIDLSVTMLCARIRTFEVGESRDLVMTYEGELYDLSVKALREENIKTPLGKFKAVVLEPTQRGEPKGAFKKGTAFRLYVSREKEPRLVRFDSLAAAVKLVALLERVDEGTPLVATPAVTTQ